MGSITLPRNGWKESLDRNEELSSLTKRLLSAALSATIEKKGKLPAVTDKEFDTIVSEVFFVRISPGTKGYILDQKGGRLHLSAQA